jgi:Transposase IS66 family
VAGRWLALARTDQFAISSDQATQTIQLQYLGFLTRRSATSDQRTQELIRLTPRMRCMSLRSFKALRAFGPINDFRTTLGSSSDAGGALARLAGVVLAVLLTLEFALRLSSAAVARHSLAVGVLTLSVMALQADAYAGFNQLYKDDRIQEVACWAHVRPQVP